MKNSSKKQRAQESVLSEETLAQVVGGFDPIQEMYEWIEGGMTDFIRGVNAGYGDYDRDTDIHYGGNDGLAPPNA